MALISQSRIFWQTGAGGTGYSVLNFGPAGNQLEANALGQLVVNFAQQVDVTMPTAVSWVVDTELRILEDTTGALQGVYQMTLNDNAGVGTGDPEYAAGVGAQIRWETGQVVNGRRLIGRTFIVPLSESAYDGGGTIAAAIQANIQTPAQTLAASGDLKVWSRPTASRPGVSHFVTGATVVDRVAWLRSRKR